MCGRAVNPNKVEDYREVLPKDFALVAEGSQLKLNLLTELPPSYISYNVAPTSLVPVISNAEPGVVQLVPWKYEMKIQGKIIPLFNSKIEQATKTNSYLKYDLQERRCVVLFKGFYEWIKQDPTNKKTLKQPVFIHLKDSPIMAMAGVFKINDDGSTGCSIITTTPVTSIEKVHNRMPFVLRPDSIFEYLSLANNKDLILEWLKHHLIDSESLVYYPVDAAVGKVANDAPMLIDRCEALFDI